MKFAIIQFPGTNNDLDMYHTIKDLVDEKVEYLSSDSDNLEGFDAVIIPGGASYGDYLRPGAIARLENIIAELQRFADKGKLVLGSGNGFQILCEAGLLPGGFISNKSLKFISKTQKLRVVNNQTPFTNHYHKDEIISLPIAHESGNYVCDRETLKTLKENKQIIFTYEEDNPNGSTENIAGISNKDRNVLGLMPHPERAVDSLFGGENGLKLFKSIVEGFKQEVEA